MGFISGNKDSAGRIDKSVKWTEEYALRMQALLNDEPEVPVLKSQPPVRAILLQNVYGGQDGLAALIGRDNITYGFLIELVGVNTHISANTFRLQLTGFHDTPESSEVIGITPPINCVATQEDMQEALLAIDDTLTPDDMVIGLGNPYYDNDLIVYGDVVPAETEDDIIASFVGSWYISFEPTHYEEYDSLSLDVVFDETTTITGLTKVTSRLSYDLLSPETTVVTDMHYRDATYPWRVGTIVLCQDYDDIGYGIVSGSFRNMVIQ